MTALLKTAEFARLCATTKETLFHYDKVGVLKPVKVHANGYRYYKTEQFFLFSLISTLARSGVSLAEIRGLLTTPERSNMMDAVRAHVTTLKEEIRNLTAREALLAILLESTDKTLSTAHGKITLAEEPHCTLRFFPLESRIFSDDAMLAKAHAACIAWDAKNVGFVMPPSGSVYSVEKGFALPTPIGVFTRVAKGYAKPSKKIKGAPTLRHLSAGFYASVTLNLITADVPSEINRFLKAVKRMGLTPRGDVYVFDEMNYLLPSNQTEEYEARFLAKVEKISRGKKS